MRRPGGGFPSLEHGLSESPRVAARQRRYNGIQRKIAGGCNMDRDIEGLVREAGFALDPHTTFTIAGPKVLGFMYCGVGHAPG